MLFSCAPSREKRHEYAIVCLWFQNFAEPTWKFFNYLGLRFRPLLRMFGRISAAPVTARRDKRLQSFNRLI
jgi:hypothetical protein